MDKAFVYDNKIVAIALYGDFSVILDNGGVAPIEVLTEVEKAIKKGANSAPSDSTQSGSDGVRTLLCTKFGWFRLYRLGGEVHSSEPTDRLLFSIVWPERIIRSVSFLTCVNLSL